MLHDIWGIIMLTKFDLIDIFNSCWCKDLSTFNCKINILNVGVTWGCEFVELVYDNYQIMSII